MRLDIFVHLVLVCLMALSSCEWEQSELQIEEVVSLIIDHPSKIDATSIEYNIEFSQTLIENHALLGLKGFLIKTFEGEDYSLICKKNIGLRPKKCSSCFQNNNGKTCVVFVENNEQEFGKAFLIKFVFAEYDNRILLEDISFE